MNSVKRSCLKGEPLIGGWLMSGSPVIAEVMAGLFDWIAIDLEHGAITIHDVEDCIRAIECAGNAEPLVRVDSIASIGRCLDAGACGIIVPNVRSANEAREAMFECLFPPDGTRSFSLARCTDYGSCSKEYFREANEYVTVVVMVETASAVAEIEAIVGIERIDAIMIGPYDLSGSLGDPGNFGSSEYLKALSDVQLACAAASMPFGIHDPYATRDNVLQYIAEGMTFIGAGMDTTTLAKASADIMTAKLDIVERRS